ncbi:MAG TPA: hypothetical protein VGM69_26100 [Chloroflexota bacterium]
MSIEAIHHRDPGDEDPTPNYSPLDVVRCRQLDLVCKTFAQAQHRLADYPNLGFDTHFVDRDQKPQTITITVRFLYGIQLVRQSLLADLTEAGHQVTAQEIAAKYQ